jgi:hypothetical protein
MLLMPLDHPPQTDDPRAQEHRLDDKPQESYRIISSRIISALSTRAWTFSPLTALSSVIEGGMVLQPNRPPCIAI